MTASGQPESHEYRINSRGNAIFIGALFSVVGLLFIATSAPWMLGVLSVNGKSRPESVGDWFLAITFVLGGALAVYFGWRAIGRLPLAIRITQDGNVEFQRLLRTTSVHVGDIEQIEKFVAKVIIEDSDPRMIRLRHAGGSMLIDNFAEVDEFLNDLTRRNQTIIVKDEWRAPRQ